MERAEPVLPHEEGHAMVATPLARLPDVDEYARRPVNPLARFAKSADQSEQSRVFHRPRRLQALQPLEEPKERNAALAAHSLSGKLFSRGLDELVLPPNAICSGLRSHGRFISLRRLTLAPSTKVWQLQLSQLTTGVSAVSARNTAAGLSPSGRLSFRGWNYALRSMQPLNFVLFRSSAGIMKLTSVP
jgi:hypothetical protein